MLTLRNLHKDVILLSNPAKKEVSQRFFKTGKGEYAEGDLFLGLTVPDCRKLALKYTDLSLQDIQKLITSKFHEERLIALLILIRQFTKADKAFKAQIFNLYLKNTKYVNNWDLVDLSAPKIVGEYLRAQNDKNILAQLAKSKNLWERRIAMLATFQFICLDKDPNYTFKIAELLFLDRCDLIQKAVGWMLREVGKRISQRKEQEFLDKYYNRMGRTTLRYAIEHFEEATRQKYLKNKII